MLSKLSEWLAAMDVQVKLGRDRSVYSNGDTLTGEIKYSLKVIVNGHEVKADPGHTIHPLI